MKRLSYYVVDAFTSEVFRGNPAGVCPLAAWLPDALLQAIAAENNLAETAFFVAAGEDYHLRWFTPIQEVAICGHATLAAAFVISSFLQPGLIEVRFQTRSGQLFARRRNQEFEMDFPAIATSKVDMPPPVLAEALGVVPDSVLVSKDDPNYCAILPDEEAVRAVHPNLERLASLHPYGVAVSAPGHEYDFVSRYFAPSYGIPEDPVTGSIHCALTPYWTRRLGKHRLRACQASSRGGHLLCSLVDTRVHLVGQAVLYLESTIAVPD